MAATRPGGGRSVLLVVHGFPPEEHTGTPLAAQGYAHELAARGWEVTVLFGSDEPGPGWAEGRPRRAREAGEPFFRLPAPRTPWRGLSWARRAAAVPAAPAHVATDSAFLALVGELRPDLVHLVDGVELPLSWPELAVASGVPVVRTVTCAEDLCGLIAPVSPCSGPRGYCEAPITPAHCASCIQAAMRPPGAAATGRALEVAERWRRDELVELLTFKRARARHHYRDVFSKVIFASPGFRAYFEETLPLDPDKVVEVPMGVDGLGGAGGVGAGPARGRDGGPLRFLAAATLHPTKGMGAVVEAFTSPEIAARADEWRLDLAGGGDTALVAPLRASASVRLHGEYTPEQLGGLLADADVGISASVFETFHRVTREYLSAGLAVLGSTAFGITEVVIDGHNGLLFDHGEDGSLRRAVLRLLDDPGLVERLRAGARATRIRTVAEEVDGLESVYAEVVGSGEPVAAGGVPSGAAART